MRVTFRKGRGREEGEEKDLCRKEGKVYQMGRMTTSSGLSSDGKIQRTRGTFEALHPKLDPFGNFASVYNS